MERYYRVLKDNFLWEKGAILQSNIHLGISGGYRPVADIWNVSEHNGEEYVSARIVENSPEWFERTYPVDLVTKTVYKSKEEAKEWFSKVHKSK